MLSLASIILSLGLSRAIHARFRVHGTFYLIYHIKLRVLVLLVEWELIQGKIETLHGWGSREL